MHAAACENLLPFFPQADQKGGAILDVGSGSGYRTSIHHAQNVRSFVLSCELVTAVFHRLAPHATVVGIDHLQSLVDLSKSNMRKDGVTLGATEGGVKIICGDGRLGVSTHYVCVLTVT